MTKRKKRGSTAQTLGGMIVGFDYQVFRTTPPPHELVQKARPVRGTSGEDGTAFEVVFPGDAASAVPAEVDEPAAADTADEAADADLADVAAGVGDANPIGPVADGLSAPRPPRPRRP
jgi:hypothetical protein